MDSSVYYNRVSDDVTRAQREIYAGKELILSSSSIPFYGKLSKQKEFI